MINAFRVAGLAAAAAFLCASPTAAAAESNEVNPAAQAAAITPIAPLDISAPTVNADQGVSSTLPAPVAQPAPIPQPAPFIQDDAAAPVTPGRTRPDRAEDALGAAPVPAPFANAAPKTRRLLADLVAEYAGTESDDAQFQCLASAVYFESRGEPLEGQLAVAEVILNRVTSGRFRGTICDVVKQPSQFSFVRRGSIPAAPRSSAAWQRAAAIAHIAMNELADVTGDDSLFFHATYVNPGWGRPRIARIGNHIFYR